MKELIKKYQLSKLTTELYFKAIQKKCEYTDGANILCLIPYHKYPLSGSIMCKSGECPLIKAEEK